MNQMKNMMVVGGGTAGCIASLMLKTAFPHLNIKLIESSKVGIVGVGESSTEHWSNFCQFIGINQLDAILHCDATFKIGVYFENWSKSDFMHSLIHDFTKTFDGYFATYSHLIANDSDPKELCGSFAFKNKISTNHFNNLNDSPTRQYHFDTFLLNKFLHNKCLEKNIEVIIDDILRVNLDENIGNIKSVIGNLKEYKSDFFIDCSGFSRFLLEKTYDVKWKSYSEYLPLNSAIAFPTDEMEEYNIYTKSTARKFGWSWTIPTQSRTGNGYVYCNQYIDRDQAHQEMEECYGQPLDIAREFKFDPGRLEKSWYKNCYAVGLSQSFVEPLEATSIGSIIQQMFCFINFFPSFDVESCNEHVNNIFDNIIDYVQAHYLVKREDTQFWRDVKYNLKLTPNLERYLHKWKNRMPNSNDFHCPWGLFSPVNYIPILYGLDWFDREKIKNEYFDYVNPLLQKNIVKELNDIKDPIFSIGHKKFIKEVLVNGYSRDQPKQKKNKENKFIYD